MISLNLPSDYEIKLKQIAHNENITVSEVIKKAVEFYFNVCKKNGQPCRLSDADERIILC
jgi:hypothetical protein